MDELKNLLMKEIAEEVERTIKNLSEKYNLNEREALSYILKNEIKSNEGRRGRPAKEEEEEKREKNPRGRPPKEEKEVKHYTGEDLISRLLKEAKIKGELKKGENNKD
jgi:replication initiation and membrane attachment protein DnaB